MLMLNKIHSAHISVRNYPVAY